MKVKKTYRLNQETQGTVAGVDNRTFVTIPQDSIISIIGPVAEESEFVDVLWDGQTVRMFACDFTERTSAITTEEPKTTALGGNSNPAPPKSEGNATTASDTPVKVRRFTASGREL